MTDQINSALVGEGASGDTWKFKFHERLERLERLEHGECPGHPKKLPGLHLHAMSQSKNHDPVTRLKWVLKRNGELDTSRNRHSVAPSLIKPSKDTQMSILRHQKRQLQLENLKEISK